MAGKIDLTRALAKPAKYMAATQRALQKTTPFVVSITPVDRGNARGHTLWDGQAIQCAYPYANRLMITGWSRQLPAGTGMPMILAQYRSLLAQEIKKI